MGTGSLNGLFLIHKTPGVTSHDVVFSLRKILKDKQVGHIGTLDPMAEGLLVCLVGESVKLSDYLMGSDKKYRLTLKLGVETDTWDITGRVLKSSDLNVSDDAIKTAVESLIGEQSLPIPMYSAKKVDGKKLYEVARKVSKEQVASIRDKEAGVSKKDVSVSDETGVDVAAGIGFEGPVKEMKFWDLKVSAIQYPFVHLEFRCTKGSFVRSWVYSLGKRLGTGAALSQVERLEIGEFSLQNSITLEALRGMSDRQQIQSSAFFLDTWSALKNRTILELEDAERDKLKNGLVSYMLSNRINDKKLKGDIFCFYNKHLVGILCVTEVIEVRRVFVNSVD